MENIKNWDTQTVATVLAAVLAFVNLFVITSSINYLIIFFIAILVLLILFQFIMRKIKKGKIEHLLVDVKIKKWRDESIDKEPFEIEKQLSALGRKVKRDIFDESAVINDWILYKPHSNPINISHFTSGLMILRPIIPPDLNCDVGAYLKFHNRKGSNAIKTNINTGKLKHIRYSVKRFNSFQGDNQDFMVPSNPEQSLNHINLSIDFEDVIPNAVFEELPYSQVVDNKSRKFFNNIEIKSSSGIRWSSSMIQKNKNESIFIQWKLVSGFPKNKTIYIFGYGSLLNPDSIYESIPNYDIKENPLIPAYLDNYTRDFSAITKNVDNLKTHENKIPEFVTYMNVIPSNGNKAFGILLKGNHKILKQLDNREWFYIRMDVTKRIRLLLPNIKLERNAVVYAYTCIQPFKFIDYSGITAFGSDYESLIEKAQNDLDKQLGTNTYAEDWTRIMRQYENWPRLKSSNTRTGDKY